MYSNYHLVLVQSFRHRPRWYNIIHDTFAQCFRYFVQFHKFSHVVEHIVIFGCCRCHLLNDCCDMTENGGIQQSWEKNQIEFSSTLVWTAPHVVPILFDINFNSVHEVQDFRFIFSLLFASGWMKFEHCLCPLGKPMIKFEKKRYKIYLVLCYFWPRIAIQVFVLWCPCILPN